jgi:transketolase
MKIPDPNLLSKLGPRANYGQALLEIASNHENLIAASADLGVSSGLDRFMKTYPERFINVGIAEQNLIGVSSGLTREGFVVFATSFAPFLTMRALEQIRMNLGYMESNVKIVSLGAGLAMGFLGNSHFGLEDLAVIKTIPGITILTPADGVELYKSIEWAYLNDGPVYIRLTGSPAYESIYGTNMEFDPGKVNSIFQGGEILVIAHGSILSNAKKAVSSLISSGIDVGLIGLSCLKPIPKQDLISNLKRYQKVLVVEEHSKIGGLNQDIASLIVEENLQIKMDYIALPDEFGPTGSHEYLLDFHGLSAIKLEATIKELYLQEKRSN